MAISLPDNIPFIGKKISYKLMFFSLVIALMPILIISFLNLSNVESNLYNTKYDNLSALASQNTLSVEEVLNTQGLNIESLAQTPTTFEQALNATLTSESVLWDSYEGKNYDNDLNKKDNKTALDWDPSNDISPFYSTYLNDFAVEYDYAEIFVTDLRGFVFASTESVPGDFVQLDEGWWTACVQSGTGIFFEFGYDDSTGQFLMDIVKTVELPNGTFVGMIKAGYNVGAISHQLEEKFVGEEQHSEGETHDANHISAFTVLGDGQIFTHEEDSFIGMDLLTLIDNTSSSNIAFRDDLVNGALHHGNTQLKIGTGTYLTGFESSDDWDFFLLVIENKATVESLVFTNMLNTFVLAFASTVICGIAAFYFSTTFAKPINKMSSITKEVAEGDLSIDISEMDTERVDEIGSLGRTFKALVSNLKGFISNSQDSATQLASSAEELASTSEEVNALSEEIAATIQQISRGASSQSELSVKAIDEVQQMSEVVDQSLKDIEGTLQVIEDIASQTNILALNAAIEAARAGEYGRGFAVVADNVRRLAEETKTNSADISKVTTEIVTNIGSSVVNLQETLQGFAAQSEEFSASSEQVAAATEEQTAAMNQMTSSAQGLTQLGEAMAQLIAQYTLDDNGDTTTTEKEFHKSPHN
ncbi:MAG: methyl-accepting chemotaxis protein [Candidatus Hodarchaeales archaeon]|jgi:methyl-accepting chemotaxis protein